MALSLIYAGGVAALGAGAYLMLRAEPTPFQVELPMPNMPVAGYNAFPIFKFIASLLPESTRRQMLVAQAAPRGEIKDRHDCTGESPYDIKEIAKDRVWRVRYDMSNFKLIVKKEKEMNVSLGTDPFNEDYRRKILTAAQQHGPKVVARVERDLEIAQKWHAKEDVPDSDMFQVPPNSVNSYVVKLGKDRVLLFAPCKVRDEHGFADWLRSVGNVEWIVIASAAHTLCLPALLKRFPSAKVIGSHPSEGKLKCVDAVPKGKFDYYSDDPTDLVKANAVLEKDGVQLHSVEGDICTYAICAVIDDKILLECDLVYTHNDGFGFLHIDKERFFELKEEDWPHRLFKLSMLTKPMSPNGYLATYRFQMMDPNNFGAILYDRPAPDGSTCRRMATSLRELVALNYGDVYGVHFDEMTRDDFRGAVDKNWNWLDGTSIV